MTPDLTLRPIGRVSSTLTDLASAPRQGDEGAPAAWLMIDPAYADAMSDLRVGDEILAIDGLTLQVSNLEALDGTPLLDVKPALGDVGDR